MPDVALSWGVGRADLAVEDDDLAGDDGLRTAVLLSLFTDRRADADDRLPADDGDRRGWWADQLAPVAGDRIGSRLWLLDRAARRPGIGRQAEEMVREALAWMIEDRVAASVEVSVEVGDTALLIGVEIVRPSGEVVNLRFAHAWEAMG